MRTILILMMLGLFTMGMVGCEADADVDDDGARLEIEED